MVIVIANTNAHGMFHCNRYFALTMQNCKECFIKLVLEMQCLEFEISF